MTVTHQRERFRIVGGADDGVIVEGEWDGLRIGCRVRFGRHGPQVTALSLEGRIRASVLRRLPWQSILAAAASADDSCIQLASELDPDDLASVAAAYVSLCASGTRAPTRELATQLGLSYGATRSALFRAREQGLLTSLGRGRPGGFLTSRGRLELQLSRAAR